MHSEVKQYFKLPDCRNFRAKMKVMYILYVHLFYVTSVDKVDEDPN